MKMNFTLTLMYFALFFLASGSVCNAQWAQVGQNINGSVSQDEAGMAVSISDDGGVVAVGLPYEDLNDPNRIGKVKIYKDLEGTWTQMGEDISDELYHNEFGYILTLSGDGHTVAVASRNLIFPGHPWQAKVYHYISENWVQWGNVFFGDTVLSGYDISLCLSTDGRTLAAGIPGSGNSSNASVGYAQVFSYLDSSWTQTGQTLMGNSTISDLFGSGVGLSGDGTILAIGAPENSQIETKNGAIKVYNLEEGIWTQQGSDILGTTEYGFLGGIISLSSNGTTVGASLYNPYMVKAFRMDADNQWTQIGEDLTGSPDLADGTGTSLSLSADGNSVAVGSPFADAGINGNEAGQARVYTYDESGWEQYGEAISGPYGNNILGYSVSLSADGQTIAVGAPWNSDYGYQTGMAQVFTYSTVGVNKISNLQGLSIYPNPSQGHVTIKLATQPCNGEVSVLTLSGKTVYSAGIQEKLTELNLAGLAIGIYALRVQTEDGIAFQKLVLQ